MNDVLHGIPVSKGNLKKIAVYQDRLEAKEFITPTKVFPFSEIISWSEVEVVQNPGNIHYRRLKIYTQKKQYAILSLHWQNYNEIRNEVNRHGQQIGEKPENHLRLIVFTLLGIAALMGAIFLVDHFQSQSLLKNGIRAKAQVTGKYYELNTKSGDTTSYMLRLVVVPDIANRKTGFQIPDRLQSYVKQKSFNKYPEGSVIEVVYEKEDTDHARLVEEIE